METELTDGAKPCPTCGAASILVEVGTASGLGTYDCPKCGSWREKNPAAAALGALGGQATSSKLTPAERQKKAEDAAKARWQGERLKQNVVPGKVKTVVSS